MIKLLKSHKTGYFSPTLRFFHGGENLFGFSSTPGAERVVHAGLVWLD